MFWKLFAKVIFKLSGWKRTEWPSGFDKCVCIEVPHTSFWDFFWGKLYFVSYGLEIGLMMKKELFFFPVGPLLKAIGTIPVDRSKAVTVVDKMVDFINSKEKIVFVITPEGTRKKVYKWKAGFYNIATKANVPVVISFLDYKNKVAGVHAVFYPSGDYEKDLKEIKSYYKGANAKHPECFTLEN